MMKFFYHKNSGRMYEIMGLDPDAGTITLQDGQGTRFTDTFDKAKFKAQGYFPVSGETKDEAREAAQAKIAAEQGEAA